MSNEKNTPGTVYTRESASAVPDIRAMLERFRLPGLDIDAFVSSRQADIDAVTHATTVALTGAQSIAETQAEILKSALTELSSMVKTIPEERSQPGELVRKEREIAQEAISHALSSMREIAETAQKSQAEILDIATQRMRGNVEEIRALFNKPE